MWERRYGFPQPQRDPQGERCYPPEQVEKLRLLKRLLDGGYRPGKLVSMPMAELRRLGVSAAPAQPGPSLAAPYFPLLEAHDAAGLRRQLSQALLGLGLERFITEHVAPTNVAIGEAWMHGALSVAQEHVYTEALQLVLRQAIGSIPEAPAGAPRVLLATLPQEGHGLGLLMVEALLALHGCRCTSLGVKVPLEGIVTAAALTHADIVGLSFSGSFNASQAVAALEELRQRLPPATRLWAGGSDLVLRRRLPPGVEAVTDISIVPDLVRRWRQARSGPAS
jgi:methylmalonyl-CoA mutase cobalamin-binding subunit